MGKIDVLVLSGNEIERLGLGMADCIRIVEETLREQAQGNVTVAHTPALHVGKGLSKLYLHAMPAYVGKPEAAGIKWVSYFPENQKVGLPDSTGIVILNDPRNGIPQCIMEGMRVTYARTAALTAVAAKYLARQDSETVGIVGAGALARASVIALKEVLPAVRIVKAVSRRESSRKAFCDTMRRLVDYEIIPVTTAQEAVEDADVIVSAPSVVTEPLIKNEWFKRGALATPLKGGSEFDMESLVSADKFLVEHWPSFRTKNENLDAIGLKLYGELGEVVCGKKPGRETDEERIISINGGVGTTDLTIGIELYRRALDRGIGTKLSLFQPTRT